MKLFQIFILLYLTQLTSGWIRFRYPLSRRNYLQQTAMEMLQNCAGNSEEVCGVCGEGPNELPTELISTKDFQLVNTSDGPLEVGLGFRMNMHGYFEMRLCKIGPNSLVNAEYCRKVAPLRIFDDFRYIPGNEQNSARLQVTLPPDVACERCVLQVRYFPGSESRLAGQLYFDCALLRIPPNTNRLQLTGRLSLSTDLPIQTPPDSPAFTTVPSTSPGMATASIRPTVPSVPIRSKPTGTRVFATNEGSLPTVSGRTGASMFDSSGVSASRVEVSSGVPGLPTSSVLTIRDTSTVSGSSFRKTASNLVQIPQEGTSFISSSNQAMDGFNKQTGLKPQDVNFENIFTSETRIANEQIDRKNAMNDAIKTKVVINNINGETKSTPIMLSGNTVPTQDLHMNSTDFVSVNGSNLEFSANLNEDINTGTIEPFIKEFPSTQVSAAGRDRIIQVENTTDVLFDSTGTSTDNRNLLTEAVLINTSTLTVQPSLSNKTNDNITSQTYNDINTGVNQVNEMENITLIQQHGKTNIGVNQINVAENTTLQPKEKTRTINVNWQDTYDMYDTNTGSGTNYDYYYDFYTYSDSSKDKTKTKTSKNVTNDSNGTSITVNDITTSLEGSINASMSFTEVNETAPTSVMSTATESIATTETMNTTDIEFTTEYDPFHSNYTTQDVLITGGNTTLQDNTTDYYFDIVTDISTTDSVTSNDTDYYTTEMSSANLSQYTTNLPRHPTGTSTSQTTNQLSTKLSVVTIPTIVIATQNDTNYEILNMTDTIINATSNETSFQQGQKIVQVADSLFDRVLFPTPKPNQDIVKVPERITVLPPPGIIQVPEELTTTSVPSVKTTHRTTINETFQTDIPHQDVTSAADEISTVLPEKQVITTASVPNVNEQTSKAVERLPVEPMTTPKEGIPFASTLADTSTSSLYAVDDLTTSHSERSSGVHVGVTTPYETLKENLTLTDVNTSKFDNKDLTNVTMVTNTFAMETSSDPSRRVVFGESSIETVTDLSTSLPVQETISQTETGGRTMTTRRSIDPTTNNLLSSTRHTTPVSYKSKTTSFDHTQTIKDIPYIISDTSASPDKPGDVISDKRIELLTSDIPTIFTGGMKSSGVTTNLFDVLKSTKSTLIPISSFKTTPATTRTLTRDAVSYLPDTNDHIDGIGGVPIQPGMFIDIFIPKYIPDGTGGNIVLQQVNGTNLIPNVNSGIESSTKILSRGSTNRNRFSKDRKSTVSTETSRPTIYRSIPTSSNFQRTSFGQFTKLTQPFPTASWIERTRERFNENNRKSQIRPSVKVNQFITLAPIIDKVVNKNVPLRVSGISGEPEIVINPLAAPDIMPPIIVPIDKKATSKSTRAGSAALDVDNMLLPPPPIETSDKRKVSSNTIWKGPGITGTQSFGLFSGPNKRKFEQTTDKLGQMTEFFGVTGPVYIPINDVAIPWNGIGSSSSLSKSGMSSVDSSGNTQINTTFSTLWDLNRLNRNQTSETKQPQNPAANQLMAPYIGIPLVWPLDDSGSGKETDIVTERNKNWQDLPVPDVMPPIKVKLLNITSDGTFIDNKALLNETGDVNQRILHKLEAIVGELQRNRALLTQSLDLSPSLEQGLQLSFSRFPTQFTSFDMDTKNPINSLQSNNVGAKRNLLSEVLQSPVIKEPVIRKGEVVSEIKQHAVTDPRGTAPISEAKIGSFLRRGGLNLMNMLGISDFRPLDVNRPSINFTFNETEERDNSLQAGDQPVNQTVIDTQNIHNDTFNILSNTLFMLMSNTSMKNASEIKTGSQQPLIRQLQDTTVVSSGINDTTMLLRSQTASPTTTSMTRNKFLSTPTGIKMVTMPLSSPTVRPTSSSPTRNGYLSTQTISVSQPLNVRSNEQLLLVSSKADSLIHINDTIKHLTNDGQAGFKPTEQVVIDINSTTDTIERNWPIVTGSNQHVVIPTGVELTDPFAGTNISLFNISTDNENITKGFSQTENQATNFIETTEAITTTASGQIVIAGDETVTAVNNLNKFGNYRRNMTHEERIRDKFVRVNFNNRLKGFTPDPSYSAATGSKYYIGDMSPRLSALDTFEPVLDKTNILVNDVEPTAFIPARKQVTIPNMVLSEFSETPSTMDTRTWPVTEQPKKIQIIRERIVTVTEQPTETPVIEKQFFDSEDILRTLTNEVGMTNTGMDGNQGMGTELTNTQKLKMGKHDDKNAAKYQQKTNARSLSDPDIQRVRVAAEIYNNLNVLQGASTELGITKTADIVVNDPLPNSYSFSPIPPSDVCPTGQTFVCKAVGDYSMVPGMVWWCFSHCKKGTCPEEKCKCVCESGHNMSIAKIATSGKIDTNGKLQSIAKLQLNEKLQTNALSGENKVREKKVINLTLNGSKEEKITLPVGPVVSAPKYQPKNVNKTGSLVITKYGPSGSLNPKDGSAILNSVSEGSLPNTIASPIVTKVLKQWEFNLLNEPSNQQELNTINELSSKREMGVNSQVIKRSEFKCKGINAFAGKPEIDRWCTRNCNRNVCPPELCVC